VADRYCRNCGHELSSEDRFCPSCGRPVHETAQVPTPEADVPVPPPPSTQQMGAQQEAAPQPTGTQPQGRSTASRLLIGCIVVLLVLFLVGACLAALGGGGGGSSGGGGDVAKEPQQQPANQEQEAQEKPAPAQGGGQEQDEQQEQAIEEPRPISLAGSGPEATRPFQLESGLTVVRMSHQGDTNFIVDLLDENGNSVAPMGVANVIGPFQGSTPVQITRGGQYLLDVQVAGQWQITVEQPRAASAPETTSFSGNSQQATQLFELSGGLHRVEMTHQGDANFIVDLLDENGASVVPMGLVNEIGPFEGSRAMQVPDDGIYLFSVQANGPWTIKVE
jgi:hypothetical protein